GRLVGEGGQHGRHLRGQRGAAQLLRLAVDVHECPLLRGGAQPPHHGDRSRRRALVRRAGDHGAEDREGPPRAAHRPRLGHRGQRGGGEGAPAQEARMTVEIRHRTLETNGIRMHVAEAGDGPLVVLCHGFPESWYSWRHQLVALAEAGYHAVAPDMRGYGQTDQPEAIEAYTLLHLVGDIVGVLDALGAPTAVGVGRDWGAPVAWHAALLRPDRFRAVIGLSVPFRPRGAVRPTTVMSQTDDAVFYQLYFQTPGMAEAEFERDVRSTFRHLLYSASGDAP